MCYSHILPLDSCECLNLVNIANEVISGVIKARLGGSNKATPKAIKNAA